MKNKKCYFVSIKTMQITQPRGEYIEKIVRDVNGQLVRLSFCVYQNNGHIKVRLLNVVHLEKKAIDNKVLLLNSKRLQNNYRGKIIFKSKIVSPYFNFDILKFSGSKPRAPTK